jgi:hypothetical protein
MWLRWYDAGALCGLFCLRRINDLNWQREWRESGRVYLQGGGNRKDGRKSAPAAPLLRMVAIGCYNSRAHVRC